MELEIEITQSEMHNTLKEVPRFLGVKKPGQRVAGMEKLAWRREGRKWYGAVRDVGGLVHGLGSGRRTCTFLAERTLKGARFLVRVNCGFFFW